MLQFELIHISKTNQSNYFAEVAIYLTKIALIMSCDEGYDVLISAPVMCTVDISRSYFFLISHSSPVGARYEVSLVNANSGRSCILVTVTLCILSCRIIDDRDISESILSMYVASKDKTEMRKPFHMSLLAKSIHILYLFSRSIILFAHFN